MSGRSVIVLVVLLAADSAVGAAIVRAQDAGVRPGAPVAPVTPTRVAEMLPGGVARPRPATPEEAAADVSLETPVPTDWLPAGTMACVRRGRMRGMCEGPRRVPRPSGADAERAARLGLGATGGASRLIFEGPDATWVAAAQAGATGPNPDDLLFPVAGGELWRGYGATRRGRRRHNHQGVDIGAIAGTLFRAANDGLVVYSDNGVRGYGNLVILVHPDASTTFYAHCRATYVFPGQLVRRGQVLGEVGSTGYARGEHLHFEWHPGGVGRNPLPHFAALPPGVRPTASQLEERALPLDRSVFHHARAHRAQRPRSRRGP